MRPELETLGAVLPDNVVVNVVALLSESMLQVEGAIQTIAEVKAHLETMGREHSRQMILRVAKDLKAVRQLVEQIDVWTFGDHAGFVAEQGRVVSEAIAAADAEFRKAAIAFLATRTP